MNLNVDARYRDSQPSKPAVCSDTFLGMDLFGFIAALSSLALAAAAVTIGVPALLDHRKRAFCRQTTERARFMHSIRGVAGIKSLGRESAYTPHLCERLLRRHRWSVVVMLSADSGVLEASVLQPKKVRHSAREVLLPVENIYGAVPKKLRTEFYRQNDDHRNPIVIHAETSKGLWMHLWINSGKPGMRETPERQAV